MKVKDIMVKDVVAIDPDDTFYDIVQVFSEKKISGAPVAKSDKPIGLISESDIMKFIANKNLINAIDADEKAVKDKASMTAKEFMTKNVIFLSPDDELSKLVKLLNDKDINRIPIVDKGKLVGIITRADVVSIVSEYLAEHPLMRKRSLEIDEPSIETNIDKLLNLVREEGSIKFKKAAKKFRVSEKRIEEWAETLEEYKLVKLNYPPIGDPKISMIKEKKKHAKKK